MENKLVVKGCVKGISGMNLDRYIKKSCGIEKYNQLKNKKGFLKKIRFYIFVILASIRDGIFQK